MHRPILRKIEIRDKLYRQRYLVPNAVTLCNMFCGFLAIMYAATDRFENAAISIAIAILLDGLDGRVARKLNATSKLGLEFDSFSDLVSFGVAPALTVYYWCFWKGADELGVAPSFIFLLCAASRLARFNISEENLSSFQGLPTPGAASFVAAMIYFYPHSLEGNLFVLLGSFVLISLGLLMVSNIEFISIKKLKVREVSPMIRLLIAATIFIIWKQKDIGFLLVTAAYCLSGPLLWLRAYYTKRYNVK